MKKLIIFGTGDIAQIAHLYFSESGEYSVEAFTVDRDFIKSDSFCGLPVHAFEDIRKDFSPDEYVLFIAVSYAGLNRVRASKYEAGKAMGYRFASYISPYASIASNAEIGENCFIFEDNTVQPFVKIGNNVTLWSGNHIGHHSTVGDSCFITSHVVISGGVHVGDFSFIGVNATLRDHIKIGMSCVIGAGAIIMNNTDDESVYVPERTKPRNMKSSELRL